MEQVDKRYQTLVVLWAALLMSTVMLFVVTLIAAPASPPPRTNLLIGFMGGAAGALIIGISLAVKNRLLKKSIDQQDVILVQKALIVGCAICEACALIGLALTFAFGGRDFYPLFFIAAGGMVLHFPRRIQLEAASYKSRSAANF